MSARDSSGSIPATAPPAGAPTPPRIPIAAALRRTFAKGYGAPQLRADLLAGVVVGIVAPIASKYGLQGLLTAGLMAGVLLVVMGVARLGSLIEYIPHPVTTGFTTGIATVIAALQIKDALGLETGPLPEHFLAKLGAF